jgi:hypothetical protein
MAKYTKTWKIGEYCQGGIITVEITGKVIVVINKEWDFSKGTRRSSDQSNAEELTRGTVTSNEDSAERKLHDFISDLATSGWADKIITWIKSKVKLEYQFY